jgi:NTE family protein
VSAAACGESAAPRTGPGAEGSAVAAQTVDVVLGRGGVRGIAIAGAVAELEQSGYRFGRLVGISAGGVIAALLAAGYSGADLRRLVGELDFARMCDRTGCGRLPVVGPLLSLFGGLGLYGGDALLEAFRRLLAARGVRTFGDLGGGAGGPPLRIVACDVTRGRMVVFPDDAGSYRVNPERMEVALALRMSISMPLFFRPLRLGEGRRASWIVDGGLLAGLPYHLLGQGDGETPALGVQAGPGRRPAPRGIRGPFSLLAASYYTALAINQHRGEPAREAERTVEIDCGRVNAVRFSLGEAEKERLYEAGVRAVRRFLARRRASAAARERLRPAPLSAA